MLKITCTPYPLPVLQRIAMQVQKLSFICGFESTDSELVTAMCPTPSGYGSNHTCICEIFS